MAPDSRPDRGHPPTSSGANLFDRAYERFTTVDQNRPCHVDDCGTPAASQEHRYSLSLTSPGRDEDRLLLFCAEHGHDAAMDHREAAAILAERATDRGAVYWGNFRERTGFGDDFDLCTCDAAEPAALWELYRARLHPFVDWQPEPCFRNGCRRLADVQAPQLCVDYEYSAWERVDRWYCRTHAATARRHAGEAEVALEKYNERCDAETVDDGRDALTAACTAELQRTRCLVQDW